MTAWELFERGGPVMYIIALLSVYAVAVVFFKVYQFISAGVFDRSFIDQALADIKIGDRERALKVLSTIPGPVAKVMRVSFNCVTNREMSQKSKEAEILRVGASDLQYLESHLRGLEMVANISPLLGLLGTVMGMVTTFSTIGAAGTRVDPSLLAGGIWEALITTVAGLIVAIPSLAAYYVIDGVIEKVRATMKDVSVQILALEDEFRRNERELARKHALQKEMEIMEERRQFAASMAAGSVAGAPADNVGQQAASSSTLRLLSPRYGHL